MSRTFVNIGKDKLYILPRVAKDSLDLSDWLKSRGIKNETLSLYAMATVIKNSLDRTKSLIPKWKFWQRWEYKKYTIEYLLGKLDELEIFEIFAAVRLLEGEDVKKKLKMEIQAQTENHPAEAVQTH